MSLSPHCQRGPTTTVGPRTGHVSLPVLLTAAHEDGGLQDRPCISPRTANGGPRRRWVPGQAICISPYCWQRPTRTMGFRTGHVSLPELPTEAHDDGGSQDRPCISPRTADRGPRERWASGQAMYLSPHCQQGPTTTAGPRTGQAALPALLAEAHEDGGLQDRPCISPRTSNGDPYVSHVHFQIGPLAVSL